MAVSSDVQSQVDSLTARLEAQEREIENLKTRGGRKQANALTDRPSSRRELLKLGGLAGAASVAAIAGLTRPETAQAAYTIVGGQDNLADNRTNLVAQANFPGNRILGLNANVNGNTGTIEGLTAFASGNAAGVRGTGGPNAGAGVFGEGGNFGVGVTGLGHDTQAGVLGRAAPAVAPG